MSKVFDPGKAARKAARKAKREEEERKLAAEEMQDKMMRHRSDNRKALLSGRSEHAQIGVGSVLG